MEEEKKPEVIYGLSFEVMSDGTYNLGHRGFSTELEILGFIEIIKSVASNTAIKDIQGPDREEHIPTPQV